MVLAAALTHTSHVHLSLTRLTCIFLLAEHPPFADSVRALAASVVQAAGADVAANSETRPSTVRGVGSWLSRAAIENAQPGESAEVADAFLFFPLQ